MIKKKPRGMPVSEAEFEEIQRLGFQGETKVDIAERMGRSTGLVSMVLKTSTLKEYQEMSRAAWQKYSKPKSPLENVQVNVPRPTETYDRLKSFREQLDDVLIDFIVGEVEKTHTELVRENKVLRQENEALQKKLDEGNPQSFITELQAKLKPSEPENRKSLSEQGTRTW